jgi:proline iminopeptidase
MNKEGLIPISGGRVYYRMEGDGDKTPMLVLHGGPGFGHDTLLSLSALGRDRKIIFYDQLGGGRSDRPIDLSLWTLERFVEELAQVRDFLGLNEVILWGGSWGAMLAVDYILTKKPQGIKGLILSNPCLSAKMWKADADRLRLQLPPEVQNTLLRHEADNTTDSKEYQAAMWEFLKRFACRFDPMPQIILDAVQQLNTQIYFYMWGPSEFHPTGTLKDYDRVNDLAQIDVPTLFVCGEYDEATPESTRIYSARVQGSKFHVIENASHVPYLEQPEAYLSVLQNFLNELEA